MRTTTDALRSLNKHVALALGPSWEVRLSTELGTFNRPFARVIQVPSIEFIAERWSRIKVQSAYQIVAFPAACSNADESEIAALEAAEALAVAFAGNTVGKSRTYRIPLYDYAGVPLTGPDAVSTEADRPYWGFMRLAGAPDIVPYQDPDDDNLWSVACNIRMSWWRTAAVPSTAQTVADVKVTPEEQDG